jgi:hypothetical protein
MSDLVSPAGTWAWGRRTGGRLGRVEEFRYTLALARALVVSRRRVPVPDGSRAVALADAPPDSAFARAAYDAARDLSSPALLAHCLRAWLYADLHAQLRGIRHDPELLYVACVLHDLGLTQAHRLQRAGCFAVEGAWAALDLAQTHGYARADDLADAVSLHLDVTVPVERGPEAHLLHAGTTTDLLGVGARALPPAARHAVVARHPGGCVVDELTAALREQAEARPRSRIAVLERRAGFTRRMRARWETHGA